MPDLAKPSFLRLLAPRSPSFALVLITAAAITLIFLAVLPSDLKVNEPTDYASFYKPVALNLLKGHGLVDNNGSLAMRYPPGYPLILAGLFGLSEALHLSEKVIISLFIALCMGLASGLIFLISKAAWGAASAVFSAAAFLTYPFTLWLTKQPNVELPFLVTLYGSFWLLSLIMINSPHKYLFSLMLGLLVGASMLIRPIALGLPLVLSLIILAFGPEVTRRRKWTLVALMLFGVILLVGPWETWVYSKNGKVILLSTGGVPSILDGLTFGVYDRGYRLGLTLPDDIQTVMRDILVQREALRSMTGIIMALIHEFQQHPLAVLKLFMLKALRSWYGTDSQGFENTILYVQIPYLIVLLWACKKSLVEDGIIKYLSVSACLIVVYFWMMSAIALPLLRYMVPAIGILFVLIPALWKVKPSLGCILKK